MPASPCTSSIQYLPNIYPASDFKASPTPVACPEDLWVHGEAEKQDRSNINAMAQGSQVEVGQWVGRSCV